MLVMVVEEMLMMVVVKKISKQFLLPKIDYYFNIGSQYYRHNSTVINNEWSLILHCLFILGMSNILCVVWVHLC